MPYEITVVARADWHNQAYLSGSYEFWCNNSIDGEYWLPQVTAQNIQTWQTIRWWQV